MRTILTIPPGNRRALANHLKRCLAEPPGYFFGSRRMFYYIEPQSLRYLNISSIIAGGGTSSRNIGFKRLFEKISAEEGLLPWWEGLLLNVGLVSGPLRIARDEGGKAAYARKEEAEGFLDLMMRAQGFKAGSEQRHKENYFFTPAADYGNAAPTEENPRDERVVNNLYHQNIQMMHAESFMAAAPEAMQTDEKSANEKIAEVVNYLLALGFTVEVAHKVVDNAGPVLDTLVALREATVADAKLKEIRAQLANMQIAPVEQFVAQAQAAPDDLISKMRELKNAREEEVIVNFLANQVLQQLNQIAAQVLKEQPAQQMQASDNPQMQQLREAFMQNQAESQAPVQTQAQNLVDIENVRRVPLEGSDRLTFDMRMAGALSQVSQDKVAVEGLQAIGLALSEFKLERGAVAVVNVDADFAAMYELASQFKFQNAATADEQGRGFSR